MSRTLWYTTIPRDWLVWEWLLDWNANDTAWTNNWTETDITYVWAERWYVNQCASFNGSSSILSLPATTLWTIWTQDFYVSWWYYLTDPWSGHYPMLFGSFQSPSPFVWPTIFFDPHNVWWWWWWWDAIQFRATGDNKFFSSTSASSLYNGWHHIVMTRISWTLYLYIDWVLDNSWSDNTDIWAADECDICRNSSKQRRHWKTWLVRAGVWIWLSQQEVQQLYQEWLRRLWPTRGIKNNWIFVGSLPNLEQGKVLEISKPQVWWTYYDQTWNWYNWTATDVSDSKVWQANVMSFNGSSSYIDTNYILWWNISTINLFYKHITDWDNTFILSQWYKNVDDGRMWLEIKDDNTLFLFQNNNGVIQISSHPLTVWETYMISIVRHSQDLWELYVNWISQWTDTWWKALTNESVLLMKLDTNYRDWHIWLVRIYNRALSDKEIQQLYYSQKWNLIN